MQTRTNVYRSQRWLGLPVAALVLGVVGTLVSGGAALASNPNEDGMALYPLPFVAPVTVDAPALRDTCLCLDLVFVVDVTGSMGGALQNVQAGLAAILNLAENTCGSVHSAVITVRDDITVDQPLTANLTDVSNAIAALVPFGGAGEPEDTDEALREAVSLAGASGVCTVNKPLGDFDPAAYRPGCCRVVILVTDARPAGCDDLFQLGVDDVNAHNVAVQATLIGAKIGAVFVPTFGDPTGEIVPIMTDYATTTGGVYGMTAADGTGTAEAIQNIILSCAGAGELEACCTPDGDCVMVLSGQCEGLGGIAHPGETCTPPDNPCGVVPRGACCLPDGTCVVTYGDVCADNGGTYYGDGSGCDPYPCITPTKPSTWGQIKANFR